MIGKVYLLALRIPVRRMKMSLEKFFKFERSLPDPNEILRNKNGFLVSMILRSTSGVLSEIRDLVDPRICRALEIFLILKMLNNSMNPREIRLSSGKYHLNRSVREYLSHEKELASYLAKLELISQKGLLKIPLTLFTRFFPRLVSREDRGRAQKESLEIFDFVSSVAGATYSKPPTGLEFNGKIVRFCMVPIKAKYPTAHYHYLTRIQYYALERKVPMIFIIAIGSLNCLVAREASRLFNSTNGGEFKLLTKGPLETKCFSGRVSQGTCMVLVRKDLCSLL